MHSGHYYAYVRGKNIEKPGKLGENWYQMNDSSVRKVKWADVANDSPYLLFYNIKQNKFNRELKKEAQVSDRVSQSVSLSVNHPIGQSADQSASPPPSVR